MGIEAGKEDSQSVVCLLRQLRTEERNPVGQLWESVPHRDFSHPMRRVRVLGYLHNIGL